MSGCFRAMSIIPLRSEGPTEGDHMFNEELNQS
jgi:hypothetical protein